MLREWSGWSLFYKCRIKYWRAGVSCQESSAGYEAGEAGRAGGARAAGGGHISWATPAQITFSLTAGQNARRMRRARRARVLAPPRRRSRARASPAADTRVPSNQR